MGWPSVTLSTDEKLTFEASTTVTPPEPSTSSVSSGPMKAAGVLVEPEARRRTGCRRAP